MATTIRPGVIQWFVFEGSINVKNLADQETIYPDSYTRVDHDPVTAEVMTPFVDADTQEVTVDYALFRSEDSAEGAEGIPDPNMGLALIQWGVDLFPPLEADTKYFVLWDEPV